MPDAIFRMDVQTKEILKTNKLTELKRWAASPKSFTLDYGDYESGRSWRPTAIFLTSLL
jgi:talin